PNRLLAKEGHMSASAKKLYRPETRLVQSGTLRSPFGETSEALFLTQGYVYDTAAQAEARFKGEDPGYQYSRFANPTVDMFERRMAAFEGAEAARATATGMAAVTLSLVGQVKAGDHVVASKAMFGSCRYVVEDFLPRFGVASTLVDGCNLDAWREAVRPNTKTFFLERPPIRHWKSSISRRSPKSRTMPARRSSSTTYLRPRYFRVRSRSAPTASCTPPPSISTARAAASAGLFSVRENSSWKRFMCCFVKPAHRFHHSMPGCCSRVWKRSQSACGGRLTAQRHLRSQLPGIQKFRG